jgi:hypothetical protein
MDSDSENLGSNPGPPAKPPRGIFLVINQWLLEEPVWPTTQVDHTEFFVGFASRRSSALSASSN